MQTQNHDTGSFPREDAAPPTSVGAGAASSYDGMTAPAGGANIPFSASTAPNGGSKKGAKAYAWRLTLLMVVILAAIVYLLCAVFRIQITDSEYYRKKVADQLIYEGTLKAERGIIYDADGEQLATNVTRYRIFISPQDILDQMSTAEEDEKPQNLHLDTQIASVLSEVTGADYNEILELTHKAGRRDETVVKSADRETADRVKEKITEYGFKNTVYVSSFNERYYLYGSLASNVLGFTGADGDGAYGLEYYYNDILSGTAGRYSMATDAYNKVISDEYRSYIEAEDGYNLQLTLKRRIQEKLEEQVKKACDDSGALGGGCGIVMNAKTGAVYGMATYPDFDCNQPRLLTGLYADQLASLGLEEDSDKYLAELGALQLQMWSNKAMSFSYIPGSTFKIITSGIVLESGTVTNKDAPDYYKCTGSILSVDRVHRIKCSSEYGHGSISFAQGLQQSCNPCFIKAGLEVGTSLFYSYMETLGYFDRSGMDLPGEGETVFWAKNKFTPADLETCAFGQNFKVSPIRHLSCLAAIANGGNLVVPHIVESVTDRQGNVISKAENTVVRQVLSKNTCNLVATTLAEGVAGNGGSRNAYVAGYRVAAKTGTSEKVGDDDEENKICSCVAFAPVEDPEIIMIIIVDSPMEGTIFGSTIAAPYVAECLSDMLPYLGVEPVYTEREAAKLSVKVGDYVGNVLFSARQSIERLGLECVVRGDGASVAAQSPEPGSMLMADSGKVVLYLGDSAPQKTIRVPELRGLSAAVASQNVLNLGLNLNITGTTNFEAGTGATVISQTPAAGTEVSAGDIITLEFRYTNLSDD